jgi:putative transposase
MTASPSTGREGLEDRRPSRSSRVWNRIPDPVRDQILNLAPGGPARSPRGGAGRFTDPQKPPRHGLPDQWRSQGAMSEASVCRLLKAHDLITGPACTVIKTTDELKDRTTAPNQRGRYGDCGHSPGGERQTGFTSLKVIGWGWPCLPTICQPAMGCGQTMRGPDDRSRDVIGWRLCGTMPAENGEPLMASRCPALVRGQRRAARSTPPRPHPAAPAPRQGRAPAPAPQDPHPAGKPRPHGRTRSRHRRLHRPLQHPPPPPKAPPESIGTMPPADVCRGRGETILAESGRTNRKPSQTAARPTTVRQHALNPMRPNPPPPDPPLQTQPAGSETFGEG